MGNGFISVRGEDLSRDSEVASDILKTIVLGPVASYAYYPMKTITGPESPYLKKPRARSVVEEVEKTLPRVVEP